MIDHLNRRAHVCHLALDQLQQIMQDSRMGRRTGATKVANCINNLLYHQQVADLHHTGNVIAVVPNTPGTLESCPRQQE
jgi:hypothetical protein